ncbi:MAG: hypothetical protein MJ003_02180 [Paludibacteraceae bacterium]|nr:hypothetical protein [Paludibacteraceae bacterium]
MKIISSKSVLLMAALSAMMLAFVSCEKNKGGSDEPIPIQSNFTPTDTAYIDLPEIISDITILSKETAELILNLIGVDYPRVMWVSGTYSSIDADGKPITLSGSITYPVNGDFKRYVVVSHYTVTSDAEAPSNHFAIESILSFFGYAVIEPDYIGYGSTKDKIHPYLVMDLTARNLYDMYVAVVPYMNQKGFKPQKDNIYVLGYSQGGSGAAALQRLIETKHTQDVTLEYSFLGGGIYDITAMYKGYVKSEFLDFPCGAILSMQSMIVYGNLSLNMNDIFQQRVVDNIDEWINSKKYKIQEVNELIGTQKTAEIFTQEGMDLESEKSKLLCEALMKNSILYTDWIPKTPTFVMHSTTDNVVLFSGNADALQQHWATNNITYDFDEYGTHFATAPLFILKAIEIMKKLDAEY